MESATTTNVEPQSPVVETAAMTNGNGAHKEQTATTTTAAIAATIQSPEQQQRPRKLSFDDSDMEMTKLKLGATVRRFPTSVVLTAIAACTISLLIRCLLPFDFGSFKAALAALERWRQSATDRIVLDYTRGYAALQATMKDTYANARSVQDPSLVLFATLFAATVTWFTYYVVYLDSSIPGVNPPTPFSASKKKRFSDKERRFHLGYVTALLSGLTVFMIIVLVD
ncbi:hypothetical protein RP20_CCG003348 [Aedes albopictus]|nr:hypothetical protein RP20_CCG003348 [Aedes albopictus]